MTTTDIDIEALIPWHAEIVEMDALKDAAIARGIDPGLVNWMAQTAALQKNIMRHNAKAMGVKPLHYGSVEEFVLVHGQPFTPPDPKHPRPKGLRKGRDRMCFMNATNATIERGLHYVEGVGQHFVPTHHAWVLDDDGNVIETTWKDSGTAYAGVEFPEYILRDAIYLTGVYGVFGQTLLEEPYDPEHPEAFIARLKAKAKKDR